MISKRIVQFLPLYLIPIPDMWSNQYSLSHYWKASNFAQKLPFFHSNSTNISRIANRTVAGERAATTAQSMYWSCPDTMRTQLRNGRWRDTNLTVRTAVRVTKPPRWSGSGFWRGLEPNWTEPNGQLKFRPLAGDPDLLLTLLRICWLWITASKSTCNQVGYKYKHYSPSIDSVI